MLPFYYLYSTIFFTISVDVDECGTHNGGCDDNCQNTVGSHTCSCNTGYTLDSNGYSCNGELKYK